MGSKIYQKFEKIRKGALGKFRKKTINGRDSEIIVKTKSFEAYYIGKQKIRKNGCSRICE